MCPKYLTWPRHFFSPRLRKYARSPALCAPAGKHFSWPSLLCHAVKSLPAPVCLRSSPFLPLGFSSFPPFLSTCFCQSPEAFYPQSSCRFSLVRRKAALFAPAVFHAPRPFKQTYAPLFSLFPHRAKPSVSLKPRRVPAPAPPFFILIISLALRPFGALRLFRANVFLPVCLAHALPPPLSAPLRRAVSPILPAFFTLF